MSVTYDAGIATSYAAAVAGGYTGTKEQYYAEQAQFAINAQRVAQDRAAVEQITTTFNTVTAPKAIQDVTDEGNTQVQRVKNKGDEYLEDIDSRIDDAVADLKDAIEQIEADKADTDGTYPDMTAGMAEQLDSDNYTEDSEPYHFRKSGGGSVRVGDREVDRIVGGTVAWNQLANGSWFITGGSKTENPDGSCVFVASAAGQQVYNGNINGYSGHKYLASVSFKTNSATTDVAMRVFSVNYAGVATTNWQTRHTIAKCYVTGGASVGVVDNRASGWDDITVNNYMLIDLTTAFGSAIADYIYSLEQSTAGAGVAFLRKYIDIDTYHPYDAGTLKSVEGLVSHDMVGFNQWDEEWELGYYNVSDGLPMASSSNIRSKNYIPAIGNTNYYCKTPTGYIAVCEYDGNKNFIKCTQAIANSGFTTTDNTCYLRFHCTSAYGTTYNHDICINLSDPAKNGTYEPYEKHSYPLDSTLTLRGLPKLVDGKLVYDGDEYSADGTITREYGITAITGDSDISAGSSGMPFKVPISGKKSTAAYTSEPNGICDKLAGVKQSSVWGVPFTFSFTMNQDYMYFKLSDSITTIEDAKTYLSSNPVTLVYELATPTTETAEPFQNPQWVDGSGTEQYISTSLVPIGHYTQYPENLKEKIEGLPWDFASLIAPTEATYKATRAYSTGNLFIVNNILYKATTSIASGATITPNTNCTQTTLAAVIAAL